MNLFKQGEMERARVVENPLPADAELVRCGVDQYDRVYLIVRSSSFEPVPNMGKIPELPETSFWKLKPDGTEV